MVQNATFGRITDFEYRSGYELYSTIEKSGNIELQALLAIVQGDHNAYIKLRKLEAKGIHLINS